MSNPAGIRLIPQHPEKNLKKWRKILDMREKLYYDTKVPV